MTEPLDSNPHCVWSTSYQPGEETWVCPQCSHAYARWWDGDTCSWRPGRPLDPIRVEYACAECEARLRRAGYTGERDGSADTGRAAPPADAGIRMPGVNA